MSNKKYTKNEQILSGWTIGDGTSTDGYHVEDYFRDGEYLGPDEHGIEPILVVNYAR